MSGAEAGAIAPSAALPQAEDYAAWFRALAEAARGHVEQVRRSLFDALTPEQVAQLKAISEAMIAANGGHGNVAFPPGCPSEDEPEESAPASSALR